MISRICGNCAHWNANHPEPKVCKECNADRKNFWPRAMKCGICDEPMIAKNGFFSCECCGTWTYPFCDGRSDSDTVRDEFEKKLPCSRNSLTSKGAMHAKSKNMGGSKSKGAKKQPSKKKSTAQLYQDLSGQPNKIKLRKIEENS